MSDLKDNLNSDYLGAGNTLQSKLKPKKVTVYVESEEDIAFWGNIFDKYVTKNRIFDIQLPSHETTLERGKSKVLEYCNTVDDMENNPTDLVTGALGENLLCCVDSDYDYLLYGFHSKKNTAYKIQTSKNINENKYILQTYAYSIENLKCFSKSLHTVCRNTTLNDDRKVDFEDFMQNYSNIIYELFLWNLYFYSKGEEADFSLEEFCSKIKILQSPEINNLLATLQDIKLVVNTTLTDFQTKYPTYIHKIKAFGKKLEKKSLNENNAYLFVQGHTIFDNVVLMLLKPLCQTLKHEHQAQIRASKKHQKDINNELIHYEKKVGKIETMLKANTEFKDCPQFIQIQQDIEKIYPKNASI